MAGSNGSIYYAVNAITNELVQVLKVVIHYVVTYF